MKLSKQERRRATQDCGGTYVPSIRVNEVNHHEWFDACTMFWRHALNVRTYSEVEVVQNGVYIVAFLAEH